MDGPRFGELIKKARARQGVKTLDLAYRIGRQQSYVSKVESGAVREVPPPDVLIALSRELGISVGEQLAALGYPIDDAPVPDQDAADLARAIAALPADRRRIVAELVDTLPRDGGRRSG